MAFIFDDIRIEVKSADIPSLLTGWKNRGIRIVNVEYVDYLTVRLSVSRWDYARFLSHQEGVTLLQNLGIVQPLICTICRPIAILTLLFLLYLSLFLPSRMLFFEVSGNERLPVNYVLDVARECGIRFGASRKTVRSEQVKNALLERIPELKWAAVTTSGCTATIHVREGGGVTEQKKLYGVSSIVAACDGVITEMTVTSGTPLCKVGDAVTEGQILVSGYTDCGLTVRASRAEAEIYAVTQRSMQAVSIPSISIRGEESGSETRYYLRIGKKLIKLFKDSGISDDTCVKIYMEKSVHLPGGLLIPVSIIQERRITMTESQYTQANAVTWMEEAAKSYLDTQMQAGSILQRSGSISGGKEAQQLYVTFYCAEMIGLIKNEEILHSDAESD